MMTSSQIRQSFLDFFKSKQHTIVPSSSLLPDSPNLLFTNAGMNQFVPIFLGQIECPYKPGRAADTQKCIRAGGKHNDLDDVGLDTYHHTFFEMLGNWSFGDYFKKEAIAWAWELIIEVWKFPAERVYATIYQPGPGDPSERDQEAWDIWAEKFRGIGLDPDIHIVNGNKKDNFWMMGETGPCGPCTEIHVDLTLGPVRTSVERQKEGALLVNGPDARCIEIWNNVFIQFNAEPDGPEEAAKMAQPGSKAGVDWIQRFVPLPAQHVDTGMGFERVVSIIHGTKNFTDFENAKISNYETDVFRPIFDEIENLSGKRYNATMPTGRRTVTDDEGKDKEVVFAVGELETMDVAFRVISDHIRTLSFSIADGIVPGNGDRNYVLRRILRRAVRYGRSLGFTQPFFYKLVDVLAAHMGDVFPELKLRREFVKQTLKTEEEAFNRTLDKGIHLFEVEADRIQGIAAQGKEKGSAGFQPASPGFQPGAVTQAPQQATAPGARFWKRRLPHYEKPHGIYHVTITTRNRRLLSPAARTIVLKAWQHFHGDRYDLFAVCVMPDHCHVLFRPKVKERPGDGTCVFYSLTELLHSIKSYTANEINKAEGRQGEPVWEEEYHDRMMRTDADVEEKFYYICRNPRADGITEPEEDYPWLWTWSEEQQPAAVERGTQVTAVRLEAGPDGLEARAPLSPAVPGVISGSFAFRLYDEQGFPFDLTELMARERGLAVDKKGFESLMEDQKTRARNAQKKTVVKLSEIGTKEPTAFLGYDKMDAESTVLEVVHLEDKSAIVLNASPFYAEMGGQLGDSGTLLAGSEIIPVLNTQKSGNTWLHLVDPSVHLEPGTPVMVRVDPSRRSAISRHHSVTHLLHWALHEVVSSDATQKGSYVGPEKLTFDFNSGALTPQQITDVERLVNERILENAPITWGEVKYADVKSRADIMQAFGEKYGDLVRVVQIGGSSGGLNGYSMELCGGTHVRGTGEIGLFRINAEAATGAGIRRIEAVAGLPAYDQSLTDSARLKQLAAKIGSPLPDLEKKLDLLVEHTKALEKTLKAAQQREASGRAKELLATASNDAIVANLGDLDADYAMAVSDALKSLFKGVVVLGTSGGGNVALIATVSPELQSKVQAGKIISSIAPIVGGKGGGKPDFARGGGKDVSKLDAALAEARKLVG
jgi:alanyl-tRNA synthetase/REP element-mobilizing transposase RayT